MKLLIVEDSRPVGERLLTAFAAVPVIDAILAANFAGAAAEFRATAPDLVILDIRLPDGNGIDLLRAIKAARPTTRVLMFSNHPACARICRAAGADGFFDKADDFDALVATVRGLARNTPPAA